MNIQEVIAAINAKDLATASCHVAFLGQKRGMVLRYYVQNAKVCVII